MFPAMTFPLVLRTFDATVTFAGGTMNTGQHVPPLSMDSISIL